MNDNGHRDTTDAPAAAGRRAFLRQSAGIATAAGVGGAATAMPHVAGSDAPERRTLRVGFMPLTDCAPLVVAASEGFDAKHGVRLVLSRETSWASVRDKLVRGELDAAQALSGMVYGLQLGLGGPQRDMAVLMTLNHNGQGISLARQMADLGAVDGPSLARLVASRDPGSFTFAQTFPTGTHALWLYYWLAAHGIHPLRDVKSIVVPPPQMIAACAAGVMHGFCVGEPWNQQGIADGVSFSVASSQAVWPDHPEKVLATTAEWADMHPHAARALTAAVLDASRWLDASDDHRTRAARLLAGAAFVDTPPEIIAGRLLGDYQDGRGSQWHDAHRIAFHGDGMVNYPYLSDGLWPLTQFRRWGLIDRDPDYLAVVRAVVRSDLYTDAAAEAGVAVPAQAMRAHRLIDGVTWDGSDPAGYATGFAITGGDARTARNDSPFPSTPRGDA